MSNVFRGCNLIKASKHPRSVFIVFSLIFFMPILFLNTCPASSLEQYAPSFKENIVQPTYLKKNTSKQELDLDGKLKLNTLIDTALKSHPSLRRSWARAKGAAATVGQALSSYYPQVSSNVFANYNDEGKYRYNDDGEYRYNEMWEKSKRMGASLGITYLLLDNGGRENTALAAKKRLEAANHAYNQSVLDLVFEVQKRYYAYVESLQMLAAKKEDLRVAKSNRERAKDFFTAGLNSKSAKLQAQAHVSQVEYQLASLKGKVRRDWRKLAIICGLPKSPRHEVYSPSKLDKDLVSKGAEQLIKRAEDKNPRLQSLEARIKSGEHRVEAAKSKFSPELSFISSGTAQKIFFQESHETGMAEDEYKATVGLKVTYDLFTGFSDSYEEREAQTNVEVTREQYAEKQLVLRQEVEDSLNEYKAALDELKASKQYVKDAKESYRVAVQFFKQGEGAMMEITRALEQLAHAKSELVGARMNMYTAAASLAHSCGAFEKLGARKAEWKTMD